MRLELHTAEQNQLWHFILQNRSKTVTFLQRVELHTVKQKQTVTLHTTKIEATVTFFLGSLDSGMTKKKTCGAAEHHL
jgi:hypothetical protein